MKEPGPEMLPLSTIYKLLDENEKEIDESRYNLRSGKLKSKFFDELREQSKKCHDYFFLDEELLKEDLLEEGN